MPQVTRREFIAISGLGIGAGAWGASSLANDENPLGKALREEGVVVKTPTYCEICFWKCAGWTYKDEQGKPWKVIGNDDDQHSMGRFCTRGTGGLGAYTDDSRLRHPLIRVKNGDKQTFREASWEEAFDYIAKGLKKIAEEHGPEHVALFSHGTGGDFFKTLLKAYGSSNITAPSYAQCRGARAEGFKLTFGEGIGSPERLDIKNTDCLVLMGSHLGENLHNTQVQEFGEIIGKGKSIITVDPRFSTAAGKSKYWLPIKPATDIALVLAWIHVLLKEDIYQKKFIAENAIGLKELQDEVKGYTPEWAYPITGLKPEDIRTTAREMARYAPKTIVHPSRHVAWYGDDTQRMRALAILNALLGNWGAKGGFYFQNKAKVPAYPHPEFPKPKSTWVDLLEGKYPFANSSPASFFRDLALKQEEKDPFFKGWIIYGTNLIQCLPEPEKTKEALNNLDLVVAIDTMPAAITGYADVVLPECTYLERYDDLRVSAGRKSQIALRAPAFKPKYNTKPGWWMVKELSKKMGLEAYFPWSNIEEYLEFRLGKVGSSLAEMNKIGVKNLPGDNPLYRAEGEKLHFQTPSGKIELYSKTLKEAGFDPIPKFTMHEQPQKGFYRLIYGRTPAHTFGRTINNPLLNEIMPENMLWVHPAVAKEWGLKTGQYIKLRNQDDVVSNKIVVRVTERIRVDCVYMAHGFGHTDPRLKRAYGKGADDSSLITRVKIDPLMGATGFRGNFVTFDFGEGV
ncbi:MAG: molybdopterin-dependent oxidoreductase [Bdellovibrionales bacterium]|nr:molybdopterin-dependent oxidoreductase [Bdellovibrionales bacterium]